MTLARVINTPSRSIGAKTVEKLLAWAEANGKTLCAALFGLPEVSLHGCTLAGTPVAK
jgi:superfamily I DNA/RNA helicase